MLVDSAEITVSGGKGGAGMPKKPKGPAGGNGGSGGNVYIIGSANLKLLNQFREKDYFKGGNGEMGARRRQTGKQGEDIEIKLPVGTSIYDKKTKKLILELSKIEERILICNGGRGGSGGDVIAEQGEPGDIRKLILSLRLIAYYGLIGLPSAGKSSLLNEITNAEAKTGNYPFTTLEPNLGVLEGKVIADIPGLIEGSSRGKGLGIAFLKHIEKVEILLHCISCETNNILEDYKIVRKELSDFNIDLTYKPEIVILTKTDTIEFKNLKKLTKEISKISKKVISVSIYDYQSLEILKKLLVKI